MALWLTMAAMTAAALLAVIWPLIYRRQGPRSGSDIEVYRDQLEELERDLAGGFIGADEAQAARIEISRRLLAAAEAQSSLAGAGPITQRRRAAAIASLLSLPVLASALYFWLGSPQLASRQLLTQRDDSAGEQSVDNLVAQAEAHLQRNPDDGQGWEVLAPVYMRLDRYSDAADAWRKALRILGETAEREANLGEALTAQANGVVTAEAKDAFQRAVSLDATIVSARYYLGVAAEQDGQREAAAKIWRDLLAGAPPGAFWVGEVLAALGRVEGTAAAPPGPSAEQMAAAANQPPDQQKAMIQGMVDRLAARLKQDGSDVDGWVRLVRAYKVLGESDNVRIAIANAQQALAADPSKLSALDAGLKELGIGGAAVGGTSAFDPGAVPAFTPRPPPDHQHDMTMEDMLERLANRLKVSGSDPEGWLTLVRSYLSMGEEDKAIAAIGNARQALAADSDKLAQFNKALAVYKIAE